MTAEEMRAYCASGENCLNCVLPECRYDGVTLDDFRRQSRLDKEARRDGLDNRTRKLAAQKRAYREANKDKLAAQQRAYREANKDKLAAQQRIRLFRKLSHISQRDFGRRVGVSGQTISFWERGQIPADWELLLKAFPELKRCMPFEGE